ncbi:terminase small subunit [Hyphomicrobium sp. D-2]|uniref:terminase small subunit n=1 Tax=Hyphomicrobium sp. D-2 TaxID=3041621 RepID=UPI002458728B|nr:terminase small subunit [Hyphomicrobium sp. D-2]MDH4981459.1 hypothetical protein [Hyphomicrobium sp. D-2]
MFDAGDNRHEGEAFNPDEAARTLGLTAKQRKLADAILSGMSQTKAAIVAGYSGEHTTATASKAANSERVRSYLAWARASGAGVPDEVCSDDELLRLLSRKARNGDANTAIKAAEALVRLKRQVQTEEAAKPVDPVNLIARMANVGPPGGLGRNSRPCVG